MEPTFAHANYERMILISANEYADLQDCKKNIKFDDVDKGPSKKRVTFADDLVATKYIPSREQLRLAEQSEDD